MPGAFWYFVLFNPVRCSIPLYRWSNWGSEVLSILTKVTGNNRRVWLSDIMLFPWHLNSFFYIPDKRYFNLFFFFFLNFIFKRHKIVLVLPNIKMNLLNTCSGISQISLFGLCLSEISFSCWTQIGSPHCFYPLVQVLLFVSPKHHILNSAASNGPSGCTPHWMIATGTRLDLCLV